MEPRVINMGAGELKRRPHRFSTGAVLALVGSLAVGSARAESIVEKALTPAAVESQTTAPQIVALPRVPLPEISSQTVDLDQGRAKQSVSTSQHQDWWIWASIAGVAIAVTAIVLLTAPSDDAPSTTLGNMKAFQ